MAQKTFDVNNKKVTLKRTARLLNSVLDYRQERAKIIKSLNYNPFSENKEDWDEENLINSQRQVALAVKKFVMPVLEMSDKDYDEADPMELQDFADSIYNWSLGMDEQAPESGEQPVLTPLDKTSTN